MVDAIPRIRGPRGARRMRPEKLHADKAYDHTFCRFVCKVRGIAPRIARRGIETSERLGRHRWVVERTISWLHTMPRLAMRRERRVDVHKGFLSLGAALLCLNYVERFC